jgi:hypothetical protein
MESSDTTRRVASPADAGEPAQDLDLIVERLTWTPAERLRHLLEMLAFEERARKARVLGPLRPGKASGG